MTSSSEQPPKEPFATKMKTDEDHVCYPNCVKFETKRCPYPGTSVKRDTCDCFRSNEDDHYIQSLIFGVYNYPKEIERIVKGHNAAIARKAREDFSKKIHDMCECVPLKEYASDYDRGFHQAMTLVRGWCTTQQREHEQGGSI